MAGKAGRSADDAARMPLMEHIRELRTRLIKSALAAVSSRSAAETRPTLGELAVCVANENGEDQERVRRHLLWLAKYGLVQLTF